MPPRTLFKPTTSDKDKKNNNKKKSAATCRYIPNQFLATGQLKVDNEAYWKSPDAPSSAAKQTIRRQVQRVLHDWILDDSDLVDNSDDKTDQPEMDLLGQVDTSWNDLGHVVVPPNRRERIEVIVEPQCDDGGNLDGHPISLDSETEQLVAKFGSLQLCTPSADKWINAELRSLQRKTPLTPVDEEKARLTLENTIRISRQMMTRRLLEAENERQHQLSLADDADAPATPSKVLGRPTVRVKKKSNLKSILPIQNNNNQPLTQAELLRKWRLEAQQRNVGLVHEKSRDGFDMPHPMGARPQPTSAPRVTQTSVLNLPSWAEETNGNPVIQNRTQVKAKELAERHPNPTQISVEEDGKVKPTPPLPVKPSPLPVKRSPLPVGASCSLPVKSKGQTNVAPLSPVKSMALLSPVMRSLPANPTTQMTVLPLTTVATQSKASVIVGLFKQSTVTQDSPRANRQHS